MADGRVDQDLLKAAQSEISQVMASATGNMTPLPSDSNVSNTADQTEGQEYVEPMQDPYNKAIKYLENHNILQMFQQLTASIVYTKPEKPLDFMLTEVERMKKEKQAEGK